MGRKSKENEMKVSGVNLIDVINEQRGTKYE